MPSGPDHGVLQKKAASAMYWIYHYGLRARTSSTLTDLEELQMTHSHSKFNSLNLRKR